MKRNLGIILIIAGAAMLIWTGVSFTKKEKVVDLGPLSVSVDKKQQVTWPPYLGGVLLVVGIIFIVTDKKR
jgi:threonine/homoserine/homoserine lactone efflux protein